MNEKIKIALEVGAIAATIGLVLLLVKQEGHNIVAAVPSNEADFIPLAPNNLSSTSVAPDYFLYPWPKIVDNPNDATGRTGLAVGTVAPGQLGNIMNIVPTSPWPKAINENVGPTSYKKGGDTFNVVNAGGGGCCDSCKSSLSLDTGKLFGGTQAAIDNYNNAINGLSKTYADNILSMFPANIRQFVNNSSGFQFSETTKAKLGSGNI